MDWMDVAEFTLLAVIAGSLWEIGSTLRGTNNLLRQQSRQLDAIATQLVSIKDVAIQALPERPGVDFRAWEPYSKE